MYSWFAVRVFNTNCFGFINTALASIPIKIIGNASKIIVNNNFPGFCNMFVLAKFKIKEKGI